MMPTLKKYIIYYGLPVVFKTSFIIKNLQYLWVDCDTLLLGRGIEAKWWKIKCENKINQVFFILYDMGNYSE